MLQSISLGQFLVFAASVPPSIPLLFCFWCCVIWLSYHLSAFACHDHLLRCAMFSLSPRSSPRRLLGDSCFLCLRSSRSSSVTTIVSSCLKLSTYGMRLSPPFHTSKVIPTFIFRKNSYGTASAFETAVTATTATTGQEQRL